MQSPADLGEPVLPRRSALFLEKTARSLADIQPGLDSVPEILVFLEVLGYSNAVAVEHGFSDLNDLAHSLYGVLDHYVDRAEIGRVQEGSSVVEVPSAIRRLGRGFALAFPWLGSLAVMSFVGVSLWLVSVLPLYITTAMIVGVFFGLLMSEGVVQLFQRLFSFYYAQYNVSEVRRGIKRISVLSVGLGAIMLVAVMFFGAFESIPFQLQFLTTLAALTIFGHRVSYTLIYSMKKYAQMVTSYAAALATLLSVYFFMGGIIPLVVNRYLVSLGAAVMVLSILPVYYTYRVFTARSAYSLDDTSSNPFSTLSILRRTIASNFGVQFWEGLPYYLYGMLFFAMLFGDRVLSWIYNPDHIANGIRLPLVFNPVYHLGADVALFVIFPTAIAQYVISSPISEQLANLATEVRVADSEMIERFLKFRYELLVLTSLVIAASVAATLIFLAPTVEAILGGTQISVFVLRIAAVANVFVAVFMANALFLIFMNRIRAVLPIVALGASMIAVGGLIFAQLGFQDVVVAYLLAGFATMTTSSAEVYECLKRPGGLFFSRYL